MSEREQFDPAWVSIQLMSALLLFLSEDVFLFPILSLTISSTCRTVFFFPPYLSLQSLQHGAGR